MRILIRGGTVVTATGSSAADVLIDGETVVALLDPAHSGSFAGLADRSIDATGKYVMPGGIDVHTHFNMPFGGTVSADDFETGTRAAAWGGTTSIVDFAVQRKGSTLREALDTWHAKAEGKASIDYGFHAIISDINEQTLKEMDILVGEGVTSFKMFMAYPGVLYSTDGEILQGMQRAASIGATIMMHAENGIAIDVLVAQALASGHTEPGWHGRTRPAELEGEATSRAIRLAQVAGVPLYIVHMSARQALEAVTEARDAGLNVFAETCPQYLYLSQDDLDKPGFEGAKYVCSPPVRPQRALGSPVARPAHQRFEHRFHRPLPVLLQRTEGAWPQRLHEDSERAARGRAPHRPAAPRRGGRRAFARPVGRGELDHASADVRPLPAQGDDRPGSDADIVVYDPSLRHVLSAQTHHMAVDYSAFEGMAVQGGVSVVMSRGEILVSDGQWHGQAGRGRFLPRGECQYLR